MGESRCAMCGKAVEPSSLESLLCPGCRATRRVFRCRVCGQQVMCMGVLDDDPMLASAVCSTCTMRARAATIGIADREAIRAAADRGVLAAVKVARERLGWSLSEAVSLVHVLSADAEPGAAADGGGT
jgi:hypothetical protein